MDVKSRHHLRSDAVSEIRETLADRLGIDLGGDAFELVELTDSPFDLVLVDGDPDVLYYERAAGTATEGSSGDEPRGREPFVTVRGANDHPPERGVVTVDAGAVSFVSDGADVMRPGITEADEGIAEGDLVVVAEETHGKALGVGRALVDGAEMTGDSGKVVKSLHHVGDDLYQFTV